MNEPSLSVTITVFFHQGNTGISLLEVLFNIILLHLLFANKKFLGFISCAYLSCQGNLKNVKLRIGTDNHREVSNAGAVSINV